MTWEWPARACDARWSSIPPPTPLGDVGTSPPPYVCPLPLGRRRRPEPLRGLARPRHVHTVWGRVRRRGAAGARRPLRPPRHRHALGCAALRWGGRLLALELEGGRLGCDCREILASDGIHPIVARPSTLYPRRRHRHAALELRVCGRGHEAAAGRGAGLRPRRLRQPAHEWRRGLQVCRARRARGEPVRACSEGGM